MEKIKVYELDFGDTNLIDQNPQVIIDWIKTDMEDAKEGDELEYTIKVKSMTQKELDELPEWS